jgi:hypothetical protein
MLLTILSCIAMIGSLANLFRIFIKEGHPNGIPFLVVLVIFAISTGYLAFQNRQLSSVEAEAASLAKSWPDIRQFNANDSAQYTAIVLRGMVFLEKHRNDFPMTFESAKAIFSTAKLHSESDDIFKQIKQSEYDHDLAVKMISTIRGIAHLPMQD